MTGYGSCQEETEQYYIFAELKAVNSKGLDVSLRLPRNYFQEELKIRQIIGEIAIRGKITLSLQVQNKTQEAAEIQINTELLQTVYKQVLALQQQLPLVEKLSWNALLALPDAFIEAKNEVQETEWLLVKNCLTKALHHLNETRVEEGKSLKEDLLNQTLTIERLLTEIEPFESNRITQIKNRILQNIKTLESDLNISEEKFQQELFFFIEKIDIHEEKVRLAAHINYFKETLEEENSGRKLAFISQEMGREINTLGSKAYELNIQKKVVEMKDALEKIKEQVNNVL